MGFQMLRGILVLTEVSSPSVKIFSPSFNVQSATLRHIFVRLHVTTRCRTCWGYHIEYGSFRTARDGEANHGGQPSVRNFGSGRPTNSLWGSLVAVPFARGTHARGYVPSSRYHFGYFTELGTVPGPSAVPDSPVTRTDPFVPSSPVYYEPSKSLDSASEAVVVSGPVYIGSAEYS